MPPEGVLSLIYAIVKRKLQNCARVFVKSRVISERIPIIIFVRVDSLDGRLTVQIREDSASPTLACRNTISRCTKVKDLG
jgi:hypothetical protein